MLLGSNGTRIILFPGTASDPPFALGYNANMLWHGTRTTGNHAFFTGTTERMRINGDGNVGIGTNNPQYLLDVFSTNTSVNNIVRISAPSQRECALLLERPSNNWTILNKGDGFGVSANNLSISSSGNGNVLDIKQNGNIGIGNTNPGNILQIGSGARLRISNGTDDYAILGTTDIDGANNTRIVLNGSTRSIDTGDIHYRATTATGDHRFYTNETTERLTIRNNGDVGIGVSDPISRLSILSDYNDLATGFSIDARTGTSAYNLRLYPLLEAAGEVGYNFRIRNLANVYDVLILAFNNVKFYKSPRAINCNYENDGELITYSSITNINGSTFGGYYIPVNKYTNSIMMCSFSHNSTVYTYWGGHITIGNNNQFFNISGINSSNLTVETYVQQTTLTYFIRVIPNVSFNYLDQLRAKIYG